MSADLAAVSAVIVSYNVREHLLACVRSLRDDGIERVVVVDNASHDGSAAAIRGADPGVEVIELPVNLGLGSGANRGVAATDTPYVAVMNPDLVVQPGSTKALLAFMEREPGVAIVGPRIETAAGDRYPSVRRFPSLLDATGHAFLWFVWPSNPFTRRYRMLDWEEGDAAADVDWVAGTHFLARRDAWEEVGGFDESYFMYGEDVDLCWRLRQAGWRVAYEPEAVVTHEIGRSTDQRPYRMILEHHRSLYRFSTRTLAGPRRLLLPVVALALAARTALAWVQRAVRRRPHAAP